MMPTSSTVLQTAPVTTGATPATSIEAGNDDSFANLVEGAAALQTATTSVAKTLAGTGDAQKLAGDQLSSQAAASISLAKASSTANAAKATEVAQSAVKQSAAAQSAAVQSLASQSETALSEAAVSVGQSGAAPSALKSPNADAADKTGNLQKPGKLGATADPALAAAALPSPIAATPSLAPTAAATPAAPVAGLPADPQAKGATAALAAADASPAGSAAPGALSDAQASTASASADTVQPSSGSHRSALAPAIEVASPVAVRVTASTTAAGASTATGAADIWRADLAASASSSTAATSDAGQASDAEPPSSLVAMIGGAQQAGEAAAPATGRGVGAPSPSNTPLAPGAVTADTAAVVGASGSTSDSGSQDNSQQGAAKTARDRATAAQTAALDGDMPDSVLEAAFGGLLAPPTTLSSSTEAPSSADAEVTPDTISDLAGQTAAQAATGAPGVKSFQIVLNPEGLGQVNVSVSIAEDGQLSAAFAFEKPEAATALSAHAKDLHDALAQSGFAVSTAGLSFTTASAQPTPATTTAAAQSLTLNLGQDFSQGSTSDQGAGNRGADSLQGIGGSVRDWSLAASQSADFASASAYGRSAPSRGVDVRV
jgi:hypothetical protein